MFKLIVTLFSLVLMTQPSMAGEHALPASSMGIIWSLPFAGILGSLALFPILAPNFWHHHYGKVSLAWALATVVPIVVLFGFNTALYSVLHTYLLEYIPFILVAMVLFTTAGGIKVQLSAPCTPLVNAGFLAGASLIASLIGTTGAAMLFIRPLLSINEHRQHKVHLVIFFILLVCNIGGSLTALGDPPLFLGFLKGVPFFWPTLNLLKPFLIVLVPVLVLFWLIDSYYYASEKPAVGTPPKNTEIKGGLNFVLLGLVMIAVVISGSWKPGISYHIMGIELELQNLLRDLAFITITIISMRFSAPSIRQYNMFSWDPLIEVAKLFAGIFITAMPVIAILGAGEHGALSDLVNLVSKDGHPDNLMYFWLTGMLSSFLDNAPTYLVFFYMAGGDAQILSTELSLTLTAISAGAVFMGALTYIGNAPNFLVKSIAEMNKIRMPSFFAYAAVACAVLLPTFILLSYLMFL